MTVFQDRNSGGNDWFLQAVRSHSVREKQRQESQLSAAWAGKSTIEGRVRDLRQIRDSVHNLVRVHGVPPSCRVELAGNSLEGAAAAGFDDAPANFERPYILLDKRPYELCNAEEVLDVYAGLGLHEAGHVLHTRDGFRRMAAGLSRHRRCYENLWEDERIEELVRLSSPGFAPYLQATKRALLERQELGQSLARWDGLPDLDKVNALIFAFIRCPYLINEVMQNWTAVNGECVFATLRKLFPAGPADEADVERGAFLLEQLWQRLRDIYAADCPKASDSASSDTGSKVDHCEERRKQQQRADAEDRAVEAATTGCQTDVQKAIQHLLEEAINSREAGDCPADAQALLEEAVRWEEAGDVWATRKGRRFSLADGEQMQRRGAAVTNPLDPAEEKALHDLECERIADGDCWEWGGDRRTVITHPVPDEAAQRSYHRATQDVRGHVAALRAALAVRFASRNHEETERTRGRLDPRRLALAPVTDRVFRRRIARSAPGLALALLLDASGSMAKGRRPKSAVALRVAALAGESVRGIPGIELEIYAHTSCGEDHRDCLVQYLHGKKNRDRAALGCYGGWYSNYDHQAILTAADLFVHNTRNPHRVLIVVSDGFPNGNGYGGKPAIEATRKAVETVRRRGLQVLNVAIGAHASETIFGAANVVHFLDLARMVADMRILLKRLIWGHGTFSTSTLLRRGQRGKALNARAGASGTI